MFCGFGELKSINCSQAGVHQDTLLRLHDLLLFLLLSIPLKGSFGVTVKLLSCDLIVTNSSHENNFLQCKVRSCTINLSLGFRIDGSFVYRVAL